MLWIAIVIFLVAVDRYTKYVINQNIEYGQMIPVIGKTFYLTNHDNYGAAWGIFQNGRYFFIVLTAIVSVVVAIYIIKSQNRFLRITLSIILGGAFGNLIDRVFKGGVTDFLDFYIGSYHFPTFNAADTFVVIGTILLMIYMLFIYKEPEKRIGKSNDEI